MKFIRVSGYSAAHPGQWVREPMTLVVAADDLAVTPAEYATQMRMPGMFVVMDEFEHEGPLEVATVVAMQRLSEVDVAETEFNQALAYHWNGAMLAHATAVLANPGPTPLTVEQTSAVLEQLANHPNYNHQIVQCYIETEEGLTLVQMQDGTLTTDITRR